MPWPPKSNLSTILEIRLNLRLDIKNHGFVLKNKKNRLVLRFDVKPRIQPTGRNPLNRIFKSTTSKGSRKLYTWLKHLKSIVKGP